MIRILSFLFLTFIGLLSFSLSAQNLGDFKPKDEGYKSKKLDDGSKKLYIASFTINFELYKEAIDKKEAGGFGRSVKNAAKAKAAVGLSTLDKEELQAQADKLYSEFVKEMTDKGYEIITTDEAGKTDFYKNFKRSEGPSIFETDMPGILSIVPTGYSFFYKDRTAASQTLSGFSKGPQALSQELDDALIADVSLIYAFTELGNDWNVGNQAKVKLNVNYRLADTYTFSNEKTSSAGITSLVDKSKQSVQLGSSINFTRGKLKIGGSPEASYAGYLKAPLEIDGVLKKEKIVAYSKQTMATATLQNPIVRIKGDNYSERTVWLEPNAEAYAEGIYKAGNKFIMHHVNEVFE